MPDREIDNFRFAAFIMTFERPTIVAETIRKLLKQSCPPQKILIVDNSVSDSTGEVVKSFQESKLSYHRVGYNAGPAGAARLGLEILAGEGYDWIYWGDDDDPPEDDSDFERLLNLARQAPHIGAIGDGGGSFNKYTGRTRRLFNNEIIGLQTVQFIPGNKNFIINAQVVRTGVLPTPGLFFGFEELDFCLKIQEAGYQLYVDGSHWLEKRRRAGLGDIGIKFKDDNWGIKLPGPRQYYSARNMLFIYRGHKLYIAFLFTFIKVVIKSLLGFRYGMEYGKRGFFFYSRALSDFILGRAGSRNFN